MSASAYEPSTASYLGKLSTGERRVMERMLVDELPLIEAEVRRRVTHFVLQSENASDVVQEVIIRILERGAVPRTPSRTDWRNLIVRIVRNTIIDRYRYYSAKQRSLAERLPLDGLSGVELPLATDDEAAPDQAASRREVRGLVQIGLHLLPDLQRQAVELRERAHLDWAEVGAALSEPGREPRSADSARMLYQRALRGLGPILDGLPRGRISDLLAAAVASEEES